MLNFCCVFLVLAWYVSLHGSARNFCLIRRCHYKVILIFMFSLETTYNKHSFGHSSHLSSTSTVLQIHSLASALDLPGRWSKSMQFRHCFWQLNRSTLLTAWAIEVGFLTLQLNINVSEMFCYYRVPDLVNLLWTRWYFIVQSTLQSHFLSHEIWSRWVYVTNASVMTWDWDSI